MQRHTAASGAGAIAGLLLIFGGLLLLLLLSPGGPSAPLASSPTVVAMVDPTVQPTSVPTAMPTEAPVRSPPTFAPDGRTGFEALDRIIDDFTTLDASALEAGYARVLVTVFGENPARLQPPAEWTRSLASAQRSLYAVTILDVVRPSGRDYNVFLSVTPPDEQPHTWRLVVRDGSLVEVVTSTSPIGHFVSVVGSNYDKFLVLPPRETLPKRPAVHAMSTRTGDAQVDSLLALVAGRNLDGLLAATDIGAAVQPNCGGGDPASMPPVQGRDILTRVVEEAVGLHGVVEVPEGYQPPAEHMLIFLLEETPYSWVTAALLERDGRLQGLITCGSSAAVLYPPRAYPAPPLTDLASLDPARRSGVAVIDAFLEGLATGDADALAAQVDYEQIACVTQGQGIGSPPVCEPGEPEGTLINVLVSGSCEGTYQRRPGALSTMRRLAGLPWSLYAAVDVGPPLPPRPGYLSFRYTAVLVLTPAAGSNPLSVVALRFSDLGLAGVRYPCGPRPPGDLIDQGISPEFLLPPQQP